MSMVVAKVARLRETMHETADAFCDLFESIIADAQAEATPEEDTDREEIPTIPKKAGKKKASKKKASKKKASKKVTDTDIGLDGEETVEDAYADDDEWIEACKSIRSEHGEDGTKAIGHVLMSEKGLKKLTDVSVGERSEFLERVAMVIQEGS